MGVGWYEERVLPRLIDVALGRALEPTRARVTAKLSGEVLEVGFGSGRNVPHYPRAVTRVLAVDPAERGRVIAARRLAASRVPVEFIGLDGQSLPLADESVDHVLVTWTLCTIPDVGRALREMHRVLRSDGRLHFVEHGRSADAKAARNQDRLTPLWGRVAGGCHLNRAIPELVAEAGFRVEELDSYRGAGSETFARMYEGVAGKR